MLIRHLSGAALCVVFAMPIIARAQVTPTAQPGQGDQAQQISPEKKELLKQLMDVIDVRKSSTQMYKIFSDQLDHERVEVLWQSLAEMKDFNALTEAEREHLRNEITETTTQNSNRYFELFNKRLDYGKVIEDIFIELYAKYFNDQELKDLLAFYQSAAGQKFRQVAPALLSESMSEASDRMMPIIRDVIKEMSAEDATKFQKEVTSLAKAHHRTATPRSKSRRGQ